MIKGMPKLPNCICGQNEWREGDGFLSFISHQESYQCINCGKMAVYHHSGLCTFFLIVCSTEKANTWIAEYNKLTKQGWAEYRLAQRIAEDAGWRRICEKYGISPETKGVENVPESLRETFIKEDTEFLNSREYFCPQGFEPLRPNCKLEHPSVVHFFNENTRSWE